MALWSMPKSYSSLFNMLTHSDPSALMFVKINRNPKVANWAVTVFSIIPFEIFYWEYLVFFFRK